MKKIEVFFRGGIGSALYLHSISLGYLSFCFFDILAIFDYYMKSKHINLEGALYVHMLQMSVS